jgi:hypothetical protein
MPHLDDPLAFDREPSNQMMLERRWWKSRISPPARRSDLRDIIALGAKLLARKIAGRSIVVKNEASLQLQFGRVLQGIGEWYQFAADDSFVVELEGRVPVDSPAPKGGTKMPRVDILLALGSGQFFATCAIELKYFQRDNSRKPRNQYDAFCDLANLEIYRHQYIDETFLFVATDDPAYVTGSSEGAAKDFDLRNGCSISAGQTLTYRGPIPPGLPITLTENYTFSWETLPITLPIWGKGTQNLHTLLVHGSKK